MESPRNAISSYRSSSTDFADKVKLAAEVYFYGYPLVYNLHEMAAFCNKLSLLKIECNIIGFLYARLNSENLVRRCESTNSLKASDVSFDTRLWSKI